jgi:hypothetical protein
MLIFSWHISKASTAAKTTDFHHFSYILVKKIVAASLPAIKSLFPIFLLRISAKLIPPMIFYLQIFARSPKKVKDSGYTLNIGLW